jgi:hypothetical protein
MKIMKWINIEREIEVEITPEDLSVLYLEDEAETQKQVMQLLNRVANALRAIDPKILAPEHLKPVYDGLISIIDKFKPC